MAKFDANLFHCLAVGPGGELPDGQVRVWNDAQLQQHQKSKDLLYRIVMLRAANLLRQTHQDASIPAEEDQHKKLAYVSLGISITSKSADRDPNKDKKTGVSGHEAPHPLSAAESSTDAGLEIAVMQDFDDGPTRLAIQEFIKVGIACPPDRDTCPKDDKN